MKKIKKTTVQVSLFYTIKGSKKIYNLSGKLSEAAAKLHCKTKNKEFPNRNYSYK